MILQSLVGYYEALAERGELPRPGWSSVRVQFALEIDMQGNLLSVLPLESADEKGKPVPRYFKMPMQLKRSGSRAPAYFLCDNAQYCLGLESGIVTEKAARCFSTFREYHREMLADVQSEAARALLAFLDNWTPQAAAENEKIAAVGDLLSKGGNFAFLLEDGRFLQEDPAIVKRWNEVESGEKNVVGRCLVMGETAEIARIHNSVKGVQTNSLSPNGWTLVGFDKDAFCSYGKTQSFNAPVGKYAAFAYTTALNHLLAQRDGDGRPRARRIGDATTVFWAEDAQPQYQAAFAAILDGGGDTVSSRELEAFVRAMAAGEAADWDGLPAEPANHFYVLGLAPNAARLSVRFFLRDTFGGMVRHIREHHDRLEIVTDNQSRWDTLRLSALLQETANKNARDKAPNAQMAGDTLRAVLTGGRYPATLYQQTQLRIRAERDVTRGRAAIIKAYLIRNCGYKIGEALMVNERDKAYCLGQLFRILENIQLKALPTLKTTIKDGYFSSASTTPANVFPRLLRLTQNHLKVISREKPGLARFFDNEIASITRDMGREFPVFLRPTEQGMFMLGYYQKCYEKKNTEEGKYHV